MCSEKNCVNKIIFISEMRNPKKNEASSTQIMTKNLLNGFNQVASQTIFVPIVSSFDDKEDIEECYSKYCDSIFIVKALTHFNKYKVLSRLSMLWCTWFRRLITIPKQLLPHLNDNVTIVSHSPTIDSAILCEAVKRRYPKIRYIQYWGDPITLSLITPEQYSFKRFIQKSIENQLHKKADKIVYGTKSLFDAQLKIFPNIKEKSFFVDVSYSADCFDCTKKHSKPIIGYIGNYYSHIRNIMPLYNAMLCINNADFIICGSSNVCLEEKNNIQIINRVPQIKVNQIEREIDVSICLLNRVGVQIPGKVYYQTNTTKDILVILDGPNKEKIQKELSISNRFIFSDNDTDSILNALNNIINKSIKFKYDREFYEPKKICLEILK